MIVARFGRPCGVAASRCASRRSDAQRSGEPSADARWCARKDDYRRRYTVERSFAWLGNFRRLLIRWEHLFTVYRSFFEVALVRLCMRRLTEEPSRATRCAT